MNTLTQTTQGFFDALCNILQKTTADATFDRVVVTLGETTLILIFAAFMLVVFMAGIFATFKDKGDDDEGRSFSDEVLKKFQERGRK